MGNQVVKFSPALVPILQSVSCRSFFFLALYDPFGVDVPLNLDNTHSLCGTRTWWHWIPLPACSHSYDNVEVPWILEFHLHRPKQGSNVHADYTYMYTQSMMTLENVTSGENS